MYLLSVTVRVPLAGLQKLRRNFVDYNTYSFSVVVWVTLTAGSMSIDMYGSSHIFEEDTDETMFLYSDGFFFRPNCH